MGTISIKAGILRRNHEYFGGRTNIPAEIFILENIVSIRFGWLTPATDNGLGSTSNAMEFQQAGAAPFSNSKNGADFYYYINDSVTERIFITCNSQDLITGLNDTDAQTYLALAVATGSGYVLQG